jgi:hypothetical protein
MKVRRTGLAAAAALLLAAIAAASLSAQQAQTPGTPKERPRDLRADDDAPAGRALARVHRETEVQARLFDGRMAMIKGALRLDEAQLKLWAPVEARLRAGFTARQQARAEREEAPRQEGERPSIAERLERRSKRLGERAERAKALAEAFRPFYASLSDEQMAVARIVLRPVLRGPGRLHRRHSDDD